MSQTVAKNHALGLSIIGVSPCGDVRDVVVGNPFPGADRCQLCDSYVIRTFEGLCLGCNVGMPDLINPTALKIILGLCSVTLCDEAAEVKVTVDGENPALCCMTHAMTLFAVRVQGSQLDAVFEPMRSAVR